MKSRLFLPPSQQATVVFHFQFCTRIDSKVENRGRSSKGCVKMKKCVQKLIPYFILYASLLQMTRHEKWILQQAQISTRSLAEKSWIWALECKQRSFASRSFVAGKSCDNLILYGAFQLLCFDLHTQHLPPITHEQTLRYYYYYYVKEKNGYNE